MTYKIKDGGAAFPQLELVAGERDGHGDAIEAFTIATGGMTLRDWFAGQAMGALYSTIDGPFKTGAKDIKDDAELFYRIADAMIAARTTGGAA